MLQKNDHPFGRSPYVMIVGLCGRLSINLKYSTTSFIHMQIVVVFNHLKSKRQRNCRAIQYFAALLRGSI